MKKLHPDLGSRFFSRELSWLAFNDRVLEEAADPSNPLLERLKYLIIVSTNLEEFFMIRVAHLFRVAKEKGESAHRDGILVSDLLLRIRHWVFDQKNRQAQIFDEISRELWNAGLRIEQAQSELALRLLKEKLIGKIVPLKIAKGENLPPIKGGMLYLLAKRKDGYFLVEFPSTLPRIHIVQSKHVFTLDRLISIYRDLIFKKQEIEELLTFKVLRDAEIEIDEEADDPLKDIEESLKDRDTGDIVRVEVDSLHRTQTVEWLQKQLNVEDERLYQLSLPLDLKSFFVLYEIKKLKKLKFPPIVLKRPEALPVGLSSTRFFRALDKQDILLHHPYYSFEPVVELLKHAATDSSVKKIATTLYRTTGKSSIVEALIQAAKAKKKVTVVVEIKARFDEANNIRWARQLQKAGAKVIYSDPNTKVHAKVIYVERKVSTGTKTYVHVSSGNYNVKTAKLYTDIGVLSSRADYGREAANFFEWMEKVSEKEDFSELKTESNFSQSFKSWIVSPNALKAGMIDKIQREIDLHRQGKASGIYLKMNGLVEHEIIDKLYEASQAGVKIDLLVRGICCLRPGVKDLSPTIKVRSIIDRYLEHSRFLIFENGGQREIYLSSADWMPRNFFRRVETSVPIVDEKIKNYIWNVIWKTYDSDNIRSRECDSDGRYHRVMNWGHEPFRAQFEFER